MKVNICCCSRLFGEGIRSLLEHALPGEAAVRICQNHSTVFANDPDLLIVDFNILSTVSLESLSARGVKMLMLGTACTPLLEDEYFMSLVSTGLAGILSPVADTEELFKAIRRICSGDLWFSRKKLEDALAHRRDSAGWEAVTLTNRERQVLELLCRGYRNKEIMEDLNISEQSVKSHVSRLCRKFTVSDRLQLVLKVIRQWPHYLYSV